jgi:hypothetical protein
MATIDDLMLGKGKATPENSVKIVKATFSTGSLQPFTTKSTVPQKYQTSHFVGR